jgi:transcriptional regulator with XRE-family HTH domain
MGEFTNLLSKLLKENKIKRGENQKDFAIRANISNNSITNFKKGKRRPDRIFTQKIAQAFDLPLELFENAMKADLQPILGVAGSDLGDKGRETEIDDLRASGAVEPMPLTKESLDRLQTLLLVSQGRLEEARLAHNDLAKHVAAVIIQAQVTMNQTQETMAATQKTMVAAQDVITKRAEDRGEERIREYLKNKSARSGKRSHTAEDKSDTDEE